jgi:pyruvate formate lyase activating enzyme
MGHLRKDEIFFRDGGGVTFSGGEPLMQPVFVIEALKACGHEGFHRAIDTCGFVDKKVIIEAAKETDLFLYDLKHMDSKKHREYLKTLSLFRSSGQRSISGFPLCRGSTQMTRM